jgi:L-malate glycosyltransferase
MATYNGARTLPEVLSAYTKLRAPAQGWNLIVVDNGSTDQTKEVIAAHAQRLPLTYLFELRLGKNVALNKGIERVIGDLVVFTDDDVLPQSDWLDQFRSTVDSQPEFTIFGGPVLPKWELHPDKWLLEWVPLSPTFAILHPAEEGPINPGLIFGPNMAIRADVFQKGFRFDETIGPRGFKYDMGDETEFNLRLSKAGYKAWHCSKAIVHHIIRSNQMTEAWVLNRAISFGRAQFRRESKESPAARASLLGIPWSLLLQIWAQNIRVRRARLSGNAKKVFQEGWQLKYLMGRASQAREMYASR